MATPVPFLTSDDSGKYLLHDEAAELLSGIEGPIAVVAVAGLYRTGKSFLLNSLLGLNGQPESFVVGNTVNACTKGLWLWGAPVKLEDGLTVVFVDSEGLGSTSRTATEDCQIFSLAILLSSHFIWNSRGTIDGNAIEDFGLVVNLSKSIHLTNSASKSGSGGGGGGAGVKELAEVFPSFMWVVRDFTLRLERNGQAIEDREYLEDALKPTTPPGEDPSSRDEIRKLLKGFFRARDCCTLVRPAEDESVLRNLNAQPLSALRPEFVKALDSLKRKVFGTLKPKMLNGQVVTGTILTSLARSYTDALNSGGVPTIGTAWDRVLASQADESLARSLALYQKLLVKAVGLGSSDGKALLTKLQQQQQQLQLQLAQPTQQQQQQQQPTSVLVSAMTSSGGGGSCVGGLPPCTLPIEASELEAIHRAAFDAAIASLLGADRDGSGRAGEGSEDATAATPPPPPAPATPAAAAAAARVVSSATMGRLSSGAALARDALENLNYMYSWSACSALARDVFRGLSADDSSLLAGGGQAALLVDGAGGGLGSLGGGGGGGGAEDDEEEEGGGGGKGDRKGVDVEALLAAAKASLRQEKNGFASSLGARLWELEHEYSLKAKGPARDEVLASALAAATPACAEKRLSAAVAAEKQVVRQLRAELAQDALKAERVSAKLATEKDVAAKEEAGMGRALENAQKAGQAECEVEEARLEVKKEELARVGADLGRLEAAFDHCLGELSGMLQGDEQLVKDLHKTYMALQEQQGASHDLAALTRAAAPLAVGKGGGGGGGDGGDSASSSSLSSTAGLGFEQLNAQIGVERREVDALSAHAALLQENIGATTELVLVKEAEVQEREFQWGMAKANVAHEEGEAMTLDEDAGVLSSLALKLRANLVNRLTNSLPSDLLKELSAEQVEMLQSLVAGGEGGAERYY